jgi:hypothetical protein
MTLAPNRQQPLSGNKRLVLLLLALVLVAGACKSKKPSAQPHVPPTTDPSMHERAQ